VIVRFFQRYALVFAILAGLVVREVVLPEDSSWWLDLAVGLPVTLAVYLPLYKRGVTNQRKPGKGSLSR
jgi:hypothetical protein